MNRDRRTDGSPGAKLCVGYHYITKNNVTVSSRSIEYIRCMDILRIMHFGIHNIMKL